MIATLTPRERQIGLFLAVCLAFLGLTMAALGGHDPIAVHGFMALALGLVLVFAVGGVLEESAPDPARLQQYYDDPIKVGIVLSMMWGVFAMAIGLWVAALMVWPDATFPYAWSSYGRLRPVHTTGVIFAFGGNALIATSFHVMQRTCRARLADQLSPWFVLIGYNLFLVWAVTGYLMGVTQSKEYAEPEWYADLWLVIVWVAYLVLYLRTLKLRAEPHIYVANWYYLAFIVVVAMLHIVNAAAIPVSFAGAKSYSAFSGV
jgi:cytochrome c oxidase cbb3-type subunit I